MAQPKEPVQATVPAQEPRLDIEGFDLDDPLDRQHLSALLEGDYEEPRYMR